MLIFAKNFDMELLPFIYGKVAETQNFTDREEECIPLSQNFFSLINTMIISPRRWGNFCWLNAITYNDTTLFSASDY